jgi:hypothetical protein
VRHLAGLRTGESLTLRADRDVDSDNGARWRVSALSADGRTIAEGWIVRAGEG